MKDTPCTFFSSTCVSDPLQVAHARSCHAVWSRCSRVSIWQSFEGLAPCSAGLYGSELSARPQRDARQSLLEGVGDPARTAANAPKRTCHPRWQAVGDAKGHNAGVNAWKNAHSCLHFLQKSKNKFGVPALPRIGFCQLNQAQGTRVPTRIKRHAEARQAGTMTIGFSDLACYLRHGGKPAHQIFNPVASAGQTRTGVRRQGRHDTRVQSGSGRCSDTGYKS